MPDLELRRARFDALFREHHPAVQAFARRRVPPEVVDDIVSETFLVVWRRLDDVPEAPLPWLLGVARNVVGTEWRGAARRERLWLRAQSGDIENYGPGDPEGEEGRVLAALDLVRRADPMRDPRVQANAGLDTESALRRLGRSGSSSVWRPPW